MDERKVISSRFGKVVQETQRMENGDDGFLVCLGYAGWLGTFFGLKSNFRRTHAVYYMTIGITNEMDTSGQLGDIGK